MLLGRGDWGEVCLSPNGEDLMKILHTALIDLERKKEGRSFKEISDCWEVVESHLLLK